nr:MAG TPA: tail component [Caudoviricetes sp.]
MLIIPLIEICENDTELVGLLTDEAGLKVSEFDANNTNGAPYICWQIIDANPEQYLSEASDMDSIYVQIDVYADTKASSRHIARLLRKNIEEYCYIEDYTGVVRDSEANLYRIRIDSRWYEEP